MDAVFLTPKVAKVPGRCLQTFPRSNGQATFSQLIIHGVPN